MKIYESGIRWKMIKMNRLSLKKAIVLSLFSMAILLAETAFVFAQFEEPVFRKIENADREIFEKQFERTLWTGQGLYNPQTIDRIPTIELRARLQAQFGDPTVTIKDLITSSDFRPGKAIQFEYWFVVDGKIPLMLLDLDGPFENGLVYVGPSEFVDQMPQVKRTLNRLLMQEVEDFSEFEDYFFSPEREQWYLVSYKDGAFTREPIDRPSFARR